MGYLEWGGNHNMFLFKAEVAIITKLFTNPTAVLHPFTLLPMIGQLLLIIALFQEKDNRLLIFTAIGCLGILLGFMLIVGILSLNYKIILSTIPFLTVAFFTVKHHLSYKNK